VQHSQEDQRIRRLASEVADPGAAEPFGAYLVGANEPGAELGRLLERDVFLEAFGNSVDDLKEEYRIYEESSLFILVLDHLRHLPAGVIRVVRPSPVGFKSLNDLEPTWGESAAVLMERTGLNFPPERIWDVATLAIPPEYRAKAIGGLVTMGLYQTLTMAARASGIELLVTILDMPVFRMLRWKMRMIFAGYRGIGPKSYLGSVASMPSWCDLLHADKHLSSVDSDLHGILFKGVGLEHAMRLADLTWVINDEKMDGGVAAAG
jgi:hypothetical protein